MQMACCSVPTTLHIAQLAPEPTAVLTSSLPFPSAQCPYHKEVIEEENLPLMQPQSLGAVWIWHLIELATANQSTVRKRQDLDRCGKIGVSKTIPGVSGLWYFNETKCIPDTYLSP